MDLALELKLGTAEELCQRMTESELGQWYAHARKHGGLPTRRIELLLANIARLSAGGDSLAPFVFDHHVRELMTPKSIATGEQAAAAISAIVGGARIIKLGVKKRARPTDGN